MARKKYKNITIKINQKLHKAFEKSLKDHERVGGEKVYKVRVIEDLLFYTLLGSGYLSEDFEREYIESKKKRPTHQYRSFLSKD